MKIHPKYGIVINPEKSKERHINRQMFAIIDDTLYFAKENTELSHRLWFIEKGWITENEDKLFGEVVRGYSNDKGVYFYKGYDFSVDIESECIMLKHLNELVDKLNLDQKLHLYGGKIKQIMAAEWEFRKDYGPIEKFILK